MLQVTRISSQLLGFCSAGILPAVRRASSPAAGERKINARARRPRNCQRDARATVRAGYAFAMLGAIFFATC